MSHFRLFSLIYAVSVYLLIFMGYFEKRNGIAAFMNIAPLIISVVQKTVVCFFGKALTVWYASVQC